MLMKTAINILWARAKLQTKISEKILPKYYRDAPQNIPTFFSLRYLLKNNTYFLFFKTPLPPTAPKANKLKTAVGSGVDTGDS